jgi:hypothetical protein
MPEKKHKKLKAKKMSSSSSRPMVGGAAKEEEAERSSAPMWAADTGSSPARLRRPAEESKPASSSSSAVTKSSVTATSTTTSARMSSASSQQQQQKQAPEPTDPYRGLIQAQKSDGSWDLASVLKYSEAKIEAKQLETEADNKIWPAWFKQLEEASKKAEIAEKSDEIVPILGSILALAVLEKTYAARKNEWIILAMKARGLITKHLQKQVEVKSGAVDWASAVTSLISAVGAAAGF